MSFIVKGIDLPRTGERVYAEIRPSGEVEYIAVTYGKDYTRSAKVERTNAVQIPKPHGRVIDGGELNKSVHTWNPAYTYGRSAFTRAIDNAPTILESEE